MSLFTKVPQRHVVTEVSPQRVLPLPLQHWKREMAAHILILTTSFRVKQITSTFVSLARASHVMTFSLKRAGNVAWKEEELEALGEQHRVGPQASITEQTLGEACLTEF